MTIESLTYHPPIPTELDQRYRKALGQVLRWQNGTLESQVAESDLDHVDSSLIIAESIARYYVHLPKEIQFQTVKNMIYLHDAGEILTGDWCLSRTEPDFIKKIHKQREKAALRYLVGKIEDPKARDFASRLARRYLLNSPTDPESLTARFIDKIQALDFGLVNVFPSPISNEEKIHASMAVRQIESTSEPLAANLSSYAQGELSDIKSKLWDNIKSHGFII